MRVISFDLPPANGKTLHQVVDGLICVMRRMGGQMRISAGRQNAAMAKDLLNLKQVNARFNQMRGITVAQAMGCNLFFRPQAATTLCMVVCTPPLSKGEIAERLPFRPALRLGNSQTGFR